LTGKKKRLFWEVDAIAARSSLTPSGSITRLELNLTYKYGASTQSPLKHFGWVFVYGQPLIFNISRHGLLINYLGGFFMKKNVVVLLALVAVCGIAWAEPIGIHAGLWPGYSYTKDNVEGSEDSSYFTLMPEIGYNGFFGNLSVSALVDYTFSFDDPAAQDLYATEEVGYALPLNEAHALAFKVYNENNLRFKPEYSSGITPDYNYVRPSVAYSLTASPGTASLGVGLPVTVSGWRTGSDIRGKTNRLRFAGK
jgi:hypothetical protein